MEIYFLKKFLKDQIRKYDGNVSVGDYQPIYDSEQVCKYATKHIGKDVDYDIVFKS